MAKVYVRPKDKIERYVDTLAKKYGGCEFSSGLVSRYYTIAGKVLRISDHIGVHNDAYLSIIVPSFKTSDCYVINGHASGQISVMDYEKAKEIVRSFFYLSTIFSEVGSDRSLEVTGEFEQNTEKVNVSKMLKDMEKFHNLRKEADKKNKTVLGISIDSFTKGQRKTILSFIKQIEENK
jgi:hypothetical protein